MTRCKDFSKAMLQLENGGMPIKVRPFAHQLSAFRFACAKLGLQLQLQLAAGKPREVMQCNISKGNGGAALLMEMG